MEDITHTEMEDCVREYVGSQVNTTLEFRRNNTVSELSLPVQGFVSREEIRFLRLQGVWYDEDRRQRPMIEFINARRMKIDGECILSFEKSKLHADIADVMRKHVQMMEPVHQSELQRNAGLIEAKLDILFRMLNAIK